MRRSRRADWDSLVFRFRNVLYGAYVLRRIQARNTLIAWLMASIGLGTAATLPTLLKALSIEEPEAVVEVSEVVLEELPETTSEETEATLPPQEPNTPPPPKRSTMRYTEPEVVEAALANPNVQVERADTTERRISTQSLDGQDDSPPVIGQINPEATDKRPPEIDQPDQEQLPDPNVFQFVEQAPRPVNMDVVRNKVEYPAMAKKAGISGKVTFRVLIDDRGRYQKHLLKKSPHPLLTQACVKHLPELRFTPAIQNKQPVPFWVTVPFDFRINQ